MLRIEESQCESVQCSPLNSTSERSTDAQRPGRVLRGGRLEIGVTRSDTDSGTDRFHRSAPPLSRFFASFLADPRKEGPRQGPEVSSSVVSVVLIRQPGRFADPSTVFILILDRTA